MNAVTAYAKHKVKNTLSDKVHQNKPSYETDPEVLAAAAEAAALQKRHWWKTAKAATPDMILSESERKLLHKVKNRAYYLDKGLQCGCFNIGLDGVVGLIPGIGDFICLVLALQLVKTACRADLPTSIVTQMICNVLFDFAIGLVPIAGDILDILFKCNWRNALLFEEFLILRRRDALRLEKGKKRNIVDDTVLNDVTSVPVTSQNPPLIQHHSDSILDIPTTTDVPVEVHEEGRKYGTFLRQ